jgi:hypothetical protein
MAQELFGVGQGIRVFDEFTAEKYSIIYGSGAPTGLLEKEYNSPKGSIFVDLSTPALYQRVAVKPAFVAVATETWATLAALTSALNDQSTPGVIGGVDATAISAGDRINVLDLTTGTEGVYVVTGTPGSAATLVLEADTASDWAFFANDTNSAEDAYLRAFIGKSASGSETPDYGASVTVVGQTDDLETAIGKLDAEAQKARTTLTSTGVTSAVTADSVLVDDYYSIKWDVYASDGTGAYRRLVVEAAHNGTGSADATSADYSTTTVLKSGAVPGFKVSVDLNGTGAAQVMRLQIQSNTSVDVRVLRHSVL